MSTINDRSDINQVLMQMRQIREQVQNSAVPPTGLQNPVQGPEGLGALAESGRTGFSDMLRQAVDSVNETQLKSAELQQAFEMGDPEVDITQVMVQMQKASVSFEAMNQVRNRLVAAYQDIMNMPI
jgi:flagellar hook-basal body complex protein FliE